MAFTVMNCIQWLNFEHSKFITLYVGKKIIDLLNICRTYMVVSTILLEHENELKWNKKSIQCDFNVKYTKKPLLNANQRFESFQKSL